MYSAFRKHLSPRGENPFEERPFLLVIVIRAGHDRFALKRDEISNESVQTQWFDVIEGNWIKLVF